MNREPSNRFSAACSVLTRNQMMYSKLSRASSMAKNAILIGHRQGLRALIRETRHHLSRADVIDAVWRSSYSCRAFDYVDNLDFSAEEIERSILQTRATPGAMRIDSINWYLPDFAHAFYGGMQTILRFAAHFSQSHRVDNRFIVSGGVGSPEPGEYSRRIAAAFPELGRCHVIVARPHDGGAAPEAEAAVSTFWPTAYRSLKANGVRRKSYFIQDYEPLFYPAGLAFADRQA